MHTLKSALINAQRLGENVIHEAKAKADSVVREATSRAQRILEAAAEREREEKDKLRQLEAEIASFKGGILSLYQQHIESLSELDRRVGDVHTAVFGEEAAAPEESSAPAEGEEITAEPVEASAIENAGSIVDSYQDAVLNRDAD